MYGMVSPEWRVNVGRFSTFNVRTDLRYVHYGTHTRKTLIGLRLNFIELLFSLFFWFCFCLFLVWFDFLVVFFSIWINLQVLNSFHHFHEGVFDACFPRWRIFLPIRLMDINKLLCSSWNESIATLRPKDIKLGPIPFTSRCRGSLNKLHLQVVANQVHGFVWVDHVPVVNKYLQELFFCHLPCLKKFLFVFNVLWISRNFG